MKEDDIKIWRLAFDDILDTLSDMYWQYCSDGHSFMSAGERASYILEKYRVYKTDGAGRVTHYFKVESKQGEKRKGKFVKIKHPNE